MRSVVFSHGLGDVLLGQLAMSVGIALPLALDLGSKSYCVQLITLKGVRTY